MPSSVKVLSNNTAKVQALPFYDRRGHEIKQRLIRILSDDF